MNKQEKIDSIKFNDIEKFNEYREKNKNTCLDLRFAYLADANLRGAQIDKKGGNN